MGAVGLLLLLHSGLTCCTLLCLQGVQMGGLSLGPQASQQQASQQQLAMQMGLNSMLQMQGAGGPAGQMLANQQTHVPGLPHQGGHMDLLHQQQAQQEMLLLRQQHLAHQMGMTGAPQVTVD